MARPKGTGFASHTNARRFAALATNGTQEPCRRAVFPRRQLSPLPKIGEGFGEWSEAFLARKVGWSVKPLQGLALQRGA